MSESTLELTLRRLNETYTADLCWRTDASAAPATLATNVPVVLDKAALLAESLNPVVYGRLLSQALFADQRLRDAWMKAQGDAAAGTLQLRLRFATGAEDLHDLCWETLCDLESDPQPLALNERIRLVRDLDSADMTPVIIPPRPTLRALVVVANPANLGDFKLAEIDVDGEVTRARTALGAIPTTILGDKQRATLANIATALRDGASILILVAHGVIVKDGPYIFLENDAGMVERVGGAEFAATMKRLKTSPLLVILAACRSGGGYDGTLGAVGPILARSGIASVLGFQGEVAMSTVKVLLPALITELQRDGQIDRALAAARGALGSQKAWWQAVLWLRTDGRLWEEATTAPTPAGTVQNVSDNATVGVLAGAIHGPVTVHQTNINTGGGDYAGRNIDKRQGTFVSGDQINLSGQFPSSTVNIGSTVQGGMIRSLSPQAAASTFRELLNTAFNVSELQTLCFDLGIDFESLAGAGKADKARELVLYVQRMGQAPALVAACRHLRPHVAWPDLS